jgi:competence protein ComEA
MRLFKRWFPMVALMGFAPLAVYADPVNINTADAATIAQALEGVGEAKAQAIVAYRQQHGHFKTVDEVGLVKGIGPKVLERNRANIRLDRARTAPGVVTAPAAKGAAAKPPAPARNAVQRKTGS